MYNMEAVNLCNEFSHAGYSECVSGEVVIEAGRAGPFSTTLHCHLEQSTETLSVLVKGRVQVCTCNTHTIFLLKFGTSNYSTSFTELWKRVPYVYAINGRKMHVHMQIFVMLNICLYKARAIFVLHVCTCISTILCVYVQFPQSGN